MKITAVLLLAGLTPASAAAGQCPENPTLEQLVACYGDQGAKQDVGAAPEDTGTDDPGPGGVPGVQPATGAGDSDC